MSALNFIGRFVWFFFCEQFSRRKTLFLDNEASSKGPLFEAKLVDRRAEAMKDSESETAFEG
jgi:hypothetical protein